MGMGKGGIHKGGLHSQGGVIFIALPLDHGLLPTPLPSPGGIRRETCPLLGSFENSGG